MLGILPFAPTAFAEGSCSASDLELGKCGTGSVSITKTVTGGVDTQDFMLQLDCSDDTFDARILLRAGGTFTAADIPPGVTCSVTEVPPTAPVGYTYAAPVITPAKPVTVVADTTVSISVVNELIGGDGGGGGDCAMSPATVKTMCNDSGTPNDPSDDTFSYTILPAGTNLGASYSISGADQQTGVPYGTAQGPFGKLPISGGDQGITLSDDDHAGCFQDVVLTPPATCSDGSPTGKLSITKVVEGGTDPQAFSIQLDCSDDAFDNPDIRIKAGVTYTVTDIPAGVSCVVSEVKPTPPAGFTYVTPIITPASPVTIVDGQTADVNVVNTLVPEDCTPITNTAVLNKLLGKDPNPVNDQSSVTVSANCGTPPPPPDPKDCTLDDPVVVTSCNDNGTPSDPEDDTFSYVITINGTNIPTKAYYHISGDDTQSEQPYGQTNGPFGQFFIREGDKFITLESDPSSGCVLSSKVTLTAPKACSDAKPTGTLEISKAVAGGIDPQAFKLQLDCSDDAFDNPNFTLTHGQTLLIPDIPEGTTCTVTETTPVAPVGFTYAAPVITPAQPVTVVANTTVSVSVLNRMTQNCSIHVPTVATSCHDNGTPSDPSDDTFSYTVNASGTAVSGSYSISGDDTQIKLTYNTTHGPFANFLISGGNKIVTLTDGANASCQRPSVVLTAPATCSSAPSTGSLSISKVVSGGTDPQAFTLQLDCSDDAFDDNAISLVAGATHVVNDIPAGTTCTVTETTPTAPAGFTYAAPTFSPAAIQTIAAGTTIDVTVTNALAPVGCTVPTVNAMMTAPACNAVTGQPAPYNYALVVQANADRIGQSNTAAYSGPDYAGATVMSPLPYTVNMSIPPSASTRHLSHRVYNGSNSCFLDVSHAFNPVPSVSGVSASNPVAPRCDVPNSGSVTLAGIDSNLQRYSVSSGSSYTGNATYATAMALPASGVIPGLTAGTHTIRIFNMEGCFQDVVVDVPAPVCVGSISVTKAVVGAPAGYDPDYQFSLQCTDPLGSSGVAYPLRAVKNGAATTFTGVPLNLSCQLVENLPAPPPGYAFAAGSPTLVPAAPYTIATGGQTIAVTATNTLVQQKIDLKINKTVDKSTVRRGETLIYTIIVENESDVDASGVEVRDDLPAGLTLVKATPSQGTFAQGVWVVGDLDAKQSATLLLEVTVD